MTLVVVATLLVVGTILMIERQSSWRQKHGDAKVSDKRLAIEREELLNSWRARHQRRQVAISDDSCAGVYSIAATSKNGLARRNIK
jgi:hypothetical protein